MAALDELAGRLSTQPGVALLFGEVVSRSAGPPVTVTLHLSGSTVDVPGVPVLECAEAVSDLAATNVVMVLAYRGDLAVLSRQAT